MSRKPNTVCSVCNKSLFSKNLDNEKITCTACRTINTIRLCKNCNKETKNLNYCSKSCAAKQNNKIPKRKLKRKCEYCDSIVRNYKSNLCITHFNLKKQNSSDFIKNQTLSDYCNRESIKRLHPSSKFANVRLLGKSWHKDMIKLPCYNCGYNKHVELAHIKPLSSFPLDSTIGEVNSINNVIQLCPNCHWEFDNGKLDLNFTNS